MHRRTFLQTAAAALGGLAATGSAAFLPPPPSVPQRLGVQLYTLRDLLPGDFNGVLERLRRIGYDEVEFAGYHERGARVIRAVLDDVGLTSPAAHLPWETFEGSLDAALDDARTLGHRYLVLPGLPESVRTSRDDYRRLADRFNHFGERTAAAGIRFAFHNHDYEFERFGGDRPAYELLLEHTDPALVSMEMDVFWTLSAGHDPLAYFERYPGRFHLLHLKDRTAAGAMVAVGAGEVNWAQIFAHAAQAGLQHAFVEHDTPEDAFQSVRSSYTHLVRLRGS